MARRRMFSLEIIDTDSFHEMPPRAKALYFCLGMRADDDGFVSSPKTIMRMASCSDNDMDQLLSSGFVYKFQSGVVLIRDWKIHNYIQKDRYKETIFLKEKAQVQTDEVGRYHVDTRVSQDGHGMDTQDSIDKDRLELEKEKNNKSPVSPKGGEGSEKSKESQTDGCLTRKPSQKSPNNADIMERFEIFYAAYPRKVGKAAACKAWVKLRPSAELFDKIMTALRKQAKSYQWQKDGGQYVPHPSTWIRGRRWEDEESEETEYGWRIAN